MKPDISEFSFGYALTEELIQGYLPPIAAAPIFPSLIQEGQAWGGYDVQLRPDGIPLFLQFKLSDYMVRNTAEEVRLGLLATPFYRVHLRPARHSDQHQMLLELEAVGNAVFYAAPAFHLPAELNAHYMDRRVFQNSVFIRPAAIGPLPDDEDHKLSFQPPNPFEPIWFLSEPKKLRESVNSDSFATRLSKTLSAPNTQIFSHETAAVLARQMIHIVKEHRAAHWASQATAFERFQKLPVLQQVVYLARTCFDCELLIAKRTKTGDNAKKLQQKD